MMNIKNLNDLKDTLKYQGFGEQLNNDLEKAVTKGEKTFTLEATHIHDLPISKPDDPLTRDKVTYELSFKQGKNEQYYFNSYQAKLESPLFKDRQQTFYLDMGRTYTAKEAYNLLSGRSVYKSLQNKEGQRYNAFVQLDFKGEQKANGNYPLKSYHENYGFRLSETIAELPIKFSSLEERDRLIKSLEKGNLQKVQLTDGQTLFAKTVPASRSLKFYDDKLQPTQVNSLKGPEVAAKAEPAPVIALDTSPEAKASSGKKKGVKL
jgi:hypothetical protein